MLRRGTGGAAALLSAFCLTTSVTPASGAATGTSAAIVLSDAELSQLSSLTQDQPDRFAGSVDDAQHHVVTVYVKGSAADRGAVINPADARAAVAGLSTKTASLYTKLGSHTTTSVDRTWTVRFVGVKNSAADLDRITSTVLTKQPLAGVLNGAEVSMYGADTASNTVHVGVKRVTPALEAAARSTYGADVQLVAMPRFALTDRLTDSKPYYNGDSIIDDGNLTISCTSGFEYVSASYSIPQLLTAGHCLNHYLYHGTWDQGYYYAQGKAKISGQIGFAGWRLPADGGYESGDDAGLITAPAGTLDDHIWTNYGLYKPTGLGSNNAGTLLCTDGAVTGENCSGKVIYGNANVCVLYDTNKNCVQWDWNTAIAVSTNNTTLCRNGDSGGPVISGSLLVHGIIVAGSTDSDFLGVTGCQYVAYTPLSVVMSAIGGGPVLD